MDEIVNVYMVPGLGFDHRIFEKLKLNKFKLTYLNWIEPKPKEKIGDYAFRMSEKITDGPEETVLIGHSFGGILCQEMEKYKRIKKIILISSIRSNTENPFHFRIVAPLFLHKLFRKSWVINTVKYWGKQHGYKTEEEQALFKDMVASHSNQYLQWALHALSNWKIVGIPESAIPIIQIHGKKDKTFPLQSVRRPDYVIEEGGHFMVYQHPEVLSQILVKELTGI